MGAAEIQMVVDRHAWSNSASTQYVLAASAGKLLYLAGCIGLSTCHQHREGRLQQP